MDPSKMYVLPEFGPIIGVLDAVPSIAHKLMSALASRIREMDRTYVG